MSGAIIGPFAENNLSCTPLSQRHAPDLQAVTISQSLAPPPPILPLPGTCLTLCDLDWHQTGLFRLAGSAAKVAEVGCADRLQ